MFRHFLTTSKQVWLPASENHDKAVEVRLYLGRAIARQRISSRCPCSNACEATLYLYCYSQLRSSVADYTLFIAFSAHQHGC
nr:MAG TPA: hypothetical protein [Caudoviricetes sp.]